MNRPARLLSTLLAAALISVAAPLSAIAAPLNTTSGVVKVSAGGDFANGHTCAILADASMLCWGTNSYGQLGNPSTDYTPEPTAVTGSHQWATMDTGVMHTCAVDTVGALYCWGLNSTGQLGISEASGYAPHTEPVQVGTDTDWSGVTSLADHTCAIKTTGTIWCWGYGDSRLGIGATPGDQNAPAQVGTDSDWAAIDAGEEMTCATKRNGTLWCWGHLDPGDWSNVTPTPAQIGTSTDNGWVGAAYFDACTISSSAGHVLRCFGLNDNGQGGNSVTPRTDLSEVSGGGSWISAGLGNWHTCGVKSNNTLWCFGDNTYGQLGTGDSADVNVPTAVGTDKSWVAVDSGKNFSCGITVGRDLYCWGINSGGQLGDGTYENKSAPVLVIDGTALPSTNGEGDAQRSQLLMQLAVLAALCAYALRSSELRSPRSRRR